MRLPHLHCILLRQLHTCPVLFGLMLLHIFLILLVITGCTGWYSFLPVLSVIFQHDIQPVIWQAVKLLVGLMSHIFFFTDISNVSHNYTADIFFSAVFCDPSGYFMKVILHCILLFPVKPLDMFRCFWIFYSSFRLLCIPYRLHSGDFFMKISFQ